MNAFPSANDSPSTSVMSSRSTVAYLTGGLSDRSSIDRASITSIIGTCRTKTVEFYCAALPKPSPYFRPLSRQTNNQ